MLEASSGVAGFNVAMLLHLVRDILRPARPGVGTSAKKFAQHAQNTPNSAFLRVLGEFFRGNVAVGAVLGELCRAVGLGVAPFYWRPADAQLNPIGGMVGSPPTQPPIGLTCA